MSVKPVFRRRSALRDVEKAVVYYAREAGLDVASRFVQSIDAVYRAIGDQPALGSLRHGQELGFPGLRTRSTSRFPFLVFYVEHEAHVEVWRILHKRSNLKAALSSERET